jgi:hypothetical protein
MALRRKDVEVVCVLVLLTFLGKCPPGFGGELAMVQILDGLLEPDGDEDAKDDGGEVNEEVAAGEAAVVRRIEDAVPMIDIQTGISAAWSTAVSGASGVSCCASQSAPGDGSESIVVSAAGEMGSCSSMRAI